MTLKFRFSEMIVWGDGVLEMVFEAIDSEFEKFANLAKVGWSDMHETSWKITK